MHERLNVYGVDKSFCNTSNFGARFGTVALAASRSMVITSAWILVVA
ncbi:hypothetical protein BVRB_1g020630 [Beta vulgaris subsp. vulgaris]|uniref:Uncharacterized protein n=1 Tax=Beta vulgaris subsp. vulgaris TaxID=3555 RepID=A0A0J8BEI9_BETVV|nr:hypothetical protein BVRB_1g020630 [Beta vulgaris subsp. vulgaris]